ncbi:MAG: DUF4837 family protein [Gemmatimonadetes bacterium]|nr:DUF4837 family protein [Gemmatimonadota bacterium]
MSRILPIPTFGPTALLAAVLAASACTKGPSYGSANAIIAVVDSALMPDLEPVLTRALEREVHTTRAEPVFEVTFTTVESIGEFRRWKRLVVVESLDEAALVPDLVDLPDDGPVAAEVHDEWSRDQTVWVFAAGTPEATVELVRQRADSLYRVIHDRYVEEQVARMWASERDSALFRSLVDSLGFGLVLPRVYQPAPGSAPADSRVWYNRDPRRVVSLHWLPRPTELSADTVLAIRRAWGAEVFPEDSIVGSLAGAPDTTAAPADTGVGAVAAAAPIQASRTTLAGREAVRLQGVWRSLEGASAGVFLTYGVACGDALVLIDGNLFAPDREKYPYLVQLERIFSTFACEREAA